MALGPYFLHKNVFIRTFIYREINTYGLPKLSKISFAFNILSLSLCKNGLFKGYPKKSPQWTFLCRKPSIKKCIGKNLGVLQPPYPPLDPPMRLPVSLSCFSENHISFMTSTQKMPYWKIETVYNVWYTQSRSAE